MAFQVPDDAEFAIPLDEVNITAGAEGLLGRGTLGEVRKGDWNGTPVALKDLLMLRTDAEAYAATQVTTTDDMPALEA
jgi:hypothetical protein